MPQPIKAPAKSPVLDPNELLRTERVQDWFLANLRPIMTGVGILVLAGAAWGIVALFQQRAEDRAAALYATANATYQDALAPERQVRAISPETKEMFERAIKEFHAVRGQYPRTAHAALALFYEGNALAGINRFDDAIAAYQTWLSTYTRKDLAPLVAQRLAYALWAKGATQEALARFEDVTKMTDAPNRDLAYFEMGRIQESLGQKDKALETYTALAKEFGASPWSSEGNARIVALGGTPPGAEVPKTSETAPHTPEGAAQPAPTGQQPAPSK
ncbi:MAG TPA: tetratricopeptide repeat protein [Nitrospiria bacterium]|nr:tetratricopeptide repeat protein [Nitrospiria bacterium]